MIYEIWKTTRFSNLEILAKMEQEMASKLEKDVITGGISKEDIKTTTDVNKNETVTECTKLNEGDNENEEHPEEYDQYNDDQDFNNRQREYYNQR